MRVYFEESVAKMREVWYDICEVRVVNVGTKIKQRRKELGMSAETLAKIIGVAPATIYRYEKGEIATLKTDKLGEIAEALCIEPKYLMGWMDQSNEPKYQEFLYTSKPSGDADIDELRKSLHEFIDSLGNEELKAMSIMIKLSR